MNSELIKTKTKKQNNRQLKQIKIVVRNKINSFMSLWKQLKREMKEAKPQ